jgi:hypothetical protein
MNTMNDDIRFDRLVDGEMNEEERRQLLAGLDAEPSGWRRCALAFLEAQCWKQAFGAAAKDNAERASSTLPLITRRSPWPGRLGTVLAMAASFVMAVWLGSMLLSGRVGPGNGWNPNINIAQNNPGPVQIEQSENHTIPVPPQHPNTAASPYRMVSISSPSNGQAINVPAVERDSIDPQWERNLPPAIPKNVLDALARTGHQVKQQRQLVPVPLKDGRQLVMPVDQVEVHYVGNNTY